MKYDTNNEISKKSIFYLIKIRRILLTVHDFLSLNSSFSMNDLLKTIRVNNLQKLNENIIINHFRTSAEKMLYSHKISVVFSHFLVMD